MPSELTRGLDRLIEKPLGNYCPEAELRMILKRRLTKKEYKIFQAEIEGSPSKEELLVKLRLDPDRYGELRENIRKKLNLDSVKKELFTEKKE